MSKQVVRLKSLRADLEREAKGDWIAAPDCGLGVEFLVTSLHTPAYRTARAELQLRLQTRFMGKPIPPEVEDKEFGSLYAKHLLLGWRGFDEPYSSDLAEQMLSDPAWRAITNGVVGSAAELGRAQAEYVDAAAGN